MVRTLAVVFVIGSAAAKADQRPVIMSGEGQWIVAKFFAETMNTADETILMLDADAAIDIGIFESIRPALRIRCREEMTDVYVTWDITLGIDDVEVLTRFDNDSTVRNMWRVGSSLRTTFHPRADHFLREMQEHSELLVQITPPGEERLLVRFDVRGLADTIVSLLPGYDACGWGEAVRELR